MGDTMENSRDYRIGVVGTFLICALWSYIGGPIEPAQFVVWAGVYMAITLIFGQ
jgi:hypothetical protein